MSFIIELAFLVGFNMSIDATQMYGIESMEDCNRMLPDIMEELKADTAICFQGDITEKTLEV